MEAYTYKRSQELFFLKFCFTKELDGYRDTFSTTFPINLISTKCSFDTSILRVEIIRAVLTDSNKPVLVFFGLFCSLFPSLPLSVLVPTSQGQMVSVSSMPALIFHHGPLPWREMFLHWVCLFNPKKKREGMRAKKLGGSKAEEKKEEKGMRENEIGGGRAMQGKMRL